MATFTVRPEGIIRQPALTMPGNATGSEAACTSLTASQIRTLLSLGTTSDVTFDIVRATTSVQTPLVNNASAALTLGNSTYGVTVPGAATFSGNVGIGTSSPGAALQVNSDTPFRLVTAAGNVIFDVVPAGTGSATFNFYRPSSAYPSGNLGGSLVAYTSTIALTSPAGCSINVGNGQGATSDYPAQSYISVIGQLHGTYFSDLVLVGGCTYGNGQTAGHLRLIGGGAAASETGVTPGNVYVHGGRGATDGNTILAHTGSATRGRVLVGTATDDGSTLLQVAGGISLKNSGYSIDFGPSYGSITCPAGGQVRLQSNTSPYAGIIAGNTQGTETASGSGGVQLVGNFHTSYLVNMRINAGGSYADGQTAGSLFLHGGSNYQGGTNSNGGHVYLHGGAGSGTGYTGRTHLAFDGSSAVGRVLVGTGTDDGTTRLQVAGSGVSGAAAFKVFPTSGTSYTQINDNGTMVINADVSTGSNPLTISYNGSSVWLFSYAGELSGAAGAYINLGAGYMHLLADSSRPRIKTYGTSPLELSPGSLDGSTAFVEINNGTLVSDGGSYRDLKCAGITASGVVSHGAYTVATLPAAGSNAGKMAQVTDSNVAASGNYGATVAAGGANRVKVFSDGTNWVIA